MDNKTDFGYHPKGGRGGRGRFPGRDDRSAEGGRLGGRSFTTLSGRGNSIVFDSGQGKSGNDRAAPTCRFDQLCNVYTCRFPHSVNLCLNWEFCPLKECRLRHKAPACKSGAACLKSECSFRHPDVCSNTFCIREFCKFRHLGTGLEKLLIRKAPQGFKNIFRRCQEVRKEHIKRINDVTLKINREAEIEGEEETTRNALLARRDELYVQLQTFDIIMEHDIEGFNKLISSTFDQKTLKTASNKFRFKFLRELFRLQLHLPALSKRNAFINELQRNQFIIVIGETGSGKSTQLIQYVAEYFQEVAVTTPTRLLSMPVAAAVENADSPETDSRKSRVSVPKKVICTQPRKVSAISLAARMAVEWAGDSSPTADGSKLVGKSVGYRVGSSKNVGPFTSMEFLTEQILLNRLVKAYQASGSNPEDRCRALQAELANVGAIIIDEAHERSITCDMLLAFLKTEVSVFCPNIKIIITSATLNEDLFRNYFNNCPVIRIPGRTFPVEVKYVPQQDNKFTADPNPLVMIQSMIKTVKEILTHEKNTSGTDILCFLTGQDEVERAKELLVQSLPSNLKDSSVVLSLYGKQPPEEQELIWNKYPGKRKIIFSTDIAETGVTIDGVRYVVDSGMCKNSVYDSTKNMTVLQVDTICKSSATQRRGRAGRTAPGVCFRLYSEEQFLSMDNSPLPEVLSSPLELTVVNLIASGIRNPLDFQWIEPPDPLAVEKALNTLNVLGAIALVSDEDAAKNRKGERHYVVTELGSWVSSSQIEPALCRMVYESSKQGYAKVACQLVGLISMADSILWRGSNDEAKKLADKAHHKFFRPEGDIATLYNVFTQWMGMLEGGDRRDIADDTDASIVEAVDLDITNLGDEAQENSLFDDSSDSSLPSLLDDSLRVATDDDVSFLDDASDLQSTVSASDMADTIGEDTLSVDETSSFCVDSIAGSIEDGMDSSLLIEDELDVKKEKKHTFAINSKAVKNWCVTHFVNNKSLRTAKSIAADLLRTLKSSVLPPERVQQACQFESCSYEMIPRMLCEGRFMNIAIQSTSRGGYQVLGSLAPGEEILPISYLHPSSTQAKENEKPSCVLFQSLFESSKRFLRGVTPIELTWIQEVSPHFYELILASKVSVPVYQLRISGVSPYDIGCIYGKGASKKKALENQFGCYIEYDDRMQTMVVWCKEADKEVLEKLLLQSIEEAKAQYLSEIEIRHISPTVRGVFKAGFELEQCLFGDEFLSIYVDKLPANVCSADITSLLGELSQYLRSTIKFVLPKLATDSASAIIDFTIPNAAKQAVHLLHQEYICDKQIIARPVHSGTSTTDKLAHTPMWAKIKLMWANAPSTGKAQVVFDSEKSANVFLARIKEIFPSSQAKKWTTRPSERTTTSNSVAVFVSQLLPNWDEEFLQNHIQRYFHNLRVLDATLSSKPVLRVSILREKSNDSEEVLNLLLAERTKMIPNSKKMTSRLTLADFKTQRSGFEVAYDSFESVVEAVNQWENDQQANNTSHVLFGQPVRLHATYTMIFQVHERVWADIRIQARAKEEIQSLMQSFPHTLLIEVKERTMKDSANKNKSSPPSLVTVYLKGTQIRNFEVARTRLQEIFTPISYVPTTLEQQQFCFSRKGREILSQISDEIAYVHWDHRIQKILIYGSTEEVKRAALDAAILRMQAVIDVQLVVSWFVPMKFKKTLMVWWTNNKPTFFDDVFALTPNTRRGMFLEITCSGTQSGIDRLQVALAAEKISIFTAEQVQEEELKRLQNDNDNRILVDCTLCGCCPPENPFVYSICRHVNCRGCCQPQFTSAIEQRCANFPFTCFMDGNPIAITDIRKLVGVNVMGNIADASLNHFLVRNLDKYFYCIKPSCNEILKKSEVKTCAPNSSDVLRFGGTETIHCTHCAVSYCLSCSEKMNKAVPVHCGLTCEENVIDPDGVVGKHVRYIASTLMNLRCPNCSTVFLDWEGCCAVTCETCKNYFCGLCFSVQANSSICHEHVKSCPRNPSGGYFVNADALREIHRKKLKDDIRQYIVNQVPKEYKKKVVFEIRQYLKDLQIEPSSLGI